MNLICLIGATLISLAYAEIKDDSASNALNQFALKFLAETNKLMPEDMNLAISPYTIWTAMAIVNEGARGNTAQELERTLDIPPNGPDRASFRELQKKIVQSVAQKSEGVTLEILNSIFTRTEAVLYQEYVNLVKSIYNVHVKPLDFKNGSAAAAHINKEISDATHGRIPAVVDANSVQNAYMLITSSLFFKGSWDKKFEKNRTSPQPFYNEHKQQIGTVSMMENVGAFPFSTILSGKAIAVELPYVGTGMSMVAILPAEEETLSSVLNELSGTSFPKLVKEMNSTREYFSATDVYVKMPKFKISSALNLNTVLYGLGLKDVFNFMSADLTSISSDKLLVSRIVHNAEVEVDEEGTIGSSSTVISIFDKISSREDFHANKPFVYFVYDKKNEIIVLSGTFCRPK